MSSDKPSRARDENGSGIPILPFILTAIRPAKCPESTRSRAACGPTMYRGRLWTMRQYAGFGSAAESNARYRYLLAQGQTGLSVAFDLPTQLGYDSDAPRRAAKSARSGSRSTRSRTSNLFDEIPLEK